MGKGLKGPKSHDKLAVSSSAVGSRSKEIIADIDIDSTHHIAEDVLRYAASVHKIDDLHSRCTGPV